MAWLRQILQFIISLFEEGGSLVCSKAGPDWFFFARLATAKRKRGELARHAGAPYCGRLL